MCLSARGKSIYVSGCYIAKGSHRGLCTSIHDNGRLLTMVVDPPD